MYPNKIFMKQNRAYRVINLLHGAPSRTMTLFEINTALHCDWAPRAISEARRIQGIEITGRNPYTLVSWPDTYFRRFEFNQESGMYKQL